MENVARVSQESVYPLSKHSIGPGRKPSHHDPKNQVHASDKSGGGVLLSLLPRPAPTGPDTAPSRGYLRNGTAVPPAHSCPPERLPSSYAPAPRQPTTETTSSCRVFFNNTASRIKKTYGSTDRREPSRATAGFLAANLRAWCLSRHRSHVVGGGWYTLSRLTR